MNIAVLDGYTLVQNDLSWDALTQFGKVEVFDRTEPEETVSRASNAEIVLTNKVAIDAATIEKLPKLKYIGVLATGYNIIDTAAASARGITVCNAPSYSTESVAQMTFAHILELCSNVGIQTDAVHAGAWEASQDFCILRKSLIELDSLTLGIIGFGAIGRSVAAKAAAFGMKIKVHTRTNPEGNIPGVEFCGLAKLLGTSDIVSLHCPLTAQNTELINSKTLALMKNSAFLINTSRGGLVNEQDLADALNSGRIAGAGLDVLSAEPPDSSNPLLCAKNCNITPHTAWGSFAARKRLMSITVSNIKAYLDGIPRNKVN